LGERGGRAQKRKKTWQENAKTSEKDFLLEKKDEEKNLNNQQLEGGEDA